MTWTALVLSVSVEACMVWYHLTGTFSQGRSILKAKRASLADETFERLMFMRGNKHHVTIFF
jgi:hypothetical protein